MPRFPKPPRALEVEGKWGQARSKYGAHTAYLLLEGEPVRVASLLEARRYVELLHLADNGLIRALECQKRFPLMLGSIKIATYVADFAYEELVPLTGGWSPVVEDSKGFRTREYKIKAKMLAAQYGVQIRETGSSPTPTNKKKRNGKEPHEPRRDRPTRSR